MINYKLFFAQYIYDIRQLRQSDVLLILLFSVDRRFSSSRSGKHTKKICAKTMYCTSTSDFRDRQTFVSIIQLRLTFHSFHLVYSLQAETPNLLRIGVQLQYSGEYFRLSRERPGFNSRQLRIFKKKENTLKIKQNI
ncbi:Hypothetical_protein [Hexamita inflata]|uniref:Hypothetical_protein n=1 Tax=Hexamita inflata TaxID=28002 RepID=A0AA86NKQ1_9EUKA|nr:Hypothetical protein HINF_LOCUS8376 [Hexamita inflata]